MTFDIVVPPGTATLLAENELKIKLNTESLTKLLRSNISCHVNKNLTQELMENLTKQIIESINFFLNQKDD